MWGGSCDLLRVAALPSKRRDPCSATCGAGLSKKRVEDPRDPCGCAGYARPRYEGFSRGILLLLLLSQP